MISIITHGGWLMLPIIFCSVISLAIIIERFFYFSTIRLNTLQNLPHIFDYVRRNRIKEAIEEIERLPSFLANILKAALLHYDQPKDVIKEAMEAASLEEFPKLEKNLNFLNMIAHISPLLGLLGTVVGMIKCFYVIEQKAGVYGVVNPSDLASGIWEALLTTAAGLSVAIPTILAYNYFVHRVNLYILSAEKACSELIEVLSQRIYEI